MGLGLKVRARARAGGHTDQEQNRKGDPLRPFLDQ